MIGLNTRIEMIEQNELNRLVDYIELGLQDPDFDMVEMDGAIFMLDLKKEDELVERLIGLMDDEAFSQSKSFLASWLMCTLEITVDDEDVPTRQLREKFVTSLRRNFFKMADDGRQLKMAQMLGVLMGEEDVFQLVVQLLEKSDEDMDVCAFYLIKEFMHTMEKPKLKQENVEVLKKVSNHSEEYMRKIGDWALLRLA
jgi:hypothetical protein